MVRDKKIDILRFIALSSLILRHIDIDKWLFQLVNFNVPLLVMASAMVLSNTQMKVDYFSYVRKRFKRLILPAWLFLIFYFILLQVTHLAPDYLTVQHIWDNFTFSNSGGFMWIIRVFLLIALVAPFIQRLDRKIQSNKLFLALLFSAFVVYEGFLLWLRTWPNGSLKVFVATYGCYAIGYGLIFALGMRLRKLSSKDLWIVGGASFLVFLGLCAFHFVQNGHFVQTQEFKYPPSAYYMSYAIAASMVTVWIAEYIVMFLSGHSWLEGVVMFIAKNSLWIYFWHTIFLFVSYRFYYQNWFFKYFEVYFLSALLVYVQFNILKALVLPRIPSEKVRKEISGLLTG